MSLIVNPGADWVVAEHSPEAAAVNVAEFARQLEALGHEVTHAPVVGPKSFDGQCRYRFTVTVNGTEHPVDMPGLPLDQVAFTGAEGQGIWDFPRLYVDESSWVWKYALDVIVGE